jgi:hypothetical protein
MHRVFQQPASREGNESNVEIRFTSGGSVSSTMFQVRGLCLIASARKAKYFWEKGEGRHEGGVSVSTFVFSKSRENEDAFSIGNCKRLGFI